MEKEEPFLNKRMVWWIVVSSTSAIVMVFGGHVGIPAFVGVLVWFVGMVGFLLTSPQTPRKVLWAGIPLVLLAGIGALASDYQQPLGIPLYVILLCFGGAFFGAIVVSSFL